MIRKLLLILLLFLFPLNFSFAACKVIFPDVGQGHCTLIGGHNGPPILVDAGSSEGKAGDAGEAVIKRIVNNLRKWIPVNAQPDDIGLMVYITHGDDDHKNWIKRIVTSLQEKHPSLKVRFLLGWSTFSLRCSRWRIQDFRGSLSPLIKSFIFLSILTVALISRH